MTIIQAISGNIAAQIAAASMAGINAAARTPSRRSVAAPMVKYTSHERIRADLDQANATIAVLKGALAASVVEAIHVPVWGLGLPRQALAIMGALISKYPRYMTAEQLADCIPGHDYGCSKNVGSVPIGIHRLRKALGGNHVIVNLSGVGFRVGHEFMAELRARSAT